MFDVIIGHKSSDPYRDRNLHYVIEYYLDKAPECNVIIVEQHTDTDVSKYGERVKYIKIDTGNDELYSRSAGYNAGMEISDKELVLLVDNDCIVVPPVMNNIKSLMGKHRALLPYNFCNDLSEKETLQLVDTSVASKGTIRGGKNVCYGGSMFVYRDAFYEIGGYDEGFMGWGAEDTAFQHKLVTLVGLGRISGEYPMFHMYHPIASSIDWRRSEGYRKNRNLLDNIKAMTKSNLLEYINSYEPTYKLIDTTTRGNDVEI